MSLSLWEERMKGEEKQSCRVASELNNYLYFSTKSMIYNIP